MFAGSRLAPTLSGANTAVIKPPDQVPLLCLRLAELLQPVFPPGVPNILPGGAKCGQALTTHPLVKKTTLIGSVRTGKAIQRAAVETPKPTHLELGGKDALIAFPDADIEQLVLGVVNGMNFTWASQSCGSLSRVFLHEDLHDEVPARVVEIVQRQYHPGDAMSVFRWSNEAELLEIVNSTPFGLTSSMFTRNLATARRIIRQV